MAERSTLTEPQAAKLGKLKITVKPDPEQLEKNVARYAEQYLRYALGVRPSTPDNHGLGQEQRQAIEAAVNKAFSIKPKPAEKNSK